MLALALQYVNHKQVIGDYRHLSCNVVALFVLLGLVPVDAVLCAVGEPSGGWGPRNCGGCGCNWLCLWFKNNRFLGVIHPNFPPQYEGVRNLAVVWAAWADTRVNAIEFQTSIGAFNLSKLLLHALGVVGVLFGQPYTGFICVV